MRDETLPEWAETPQLRALLRSTRRARTRPTRFNGKTSSPDFCIGKVTPDQRPCRGANFLDTVEKLPIAARLMSRFSCLCLNEAETLR
jgi:hypothetical protein